MSRPAGAQLVARARTVTGERVRVDFNQDLQSFVAVTGSGEMFGNTRLVECLTVPALASLMASRHANLDPAWVSELAALEQTVAKQIGEAHFVGIDDPNRLQLRVVAPNGSLAEVKGRGVYSPDGPSWGYSGSGPAEAAETMLVTASGGACIPKQWVGGFANEIVADLPPRWSMKVTDVSLWAAHGRVPLTKTQGAVLARAVDQFAAANDLTRVARRPPVSRTL